MTPFWISWWAHPVVGWELHTPWWISGERADGRSSVCAAIMATSEENARWLISSAHDQYPALEWRFVEERPTGWQPFCTRFERADWMKWE